MCPNLDGFPRELEWVATRIELHGSARTPTTEAAHPRALRSRARSTRVGINREKSGFAQQSFWLATLEPMPSFLGQWRNRHPTEWSNGNGPCLLFAGFCKTKSMPGPAEWQGWNGPQRQRNAAPMHSQFSSCANMPDCDDTTVSLGAAVSGIPARVREQPVANHHVSASFTMSEPRSLRAFVSAPRVRLR